MDIVYIHVFQLRIWCNQVLHGEEIII